MIYKYDKNTKEYIGSMTKQIDPLETILKGKEVFVIPPSCTDVPPPEFKEGKVLIFDEDKNNWTEKEDHRGKVVFNSSGEHFVISEIGECPEGYSFSKPLDIRALKEDKREEIIEKYFIELSSYIKVGNLEIKVTDDIKIRERLEMTKDYNLVSFDEENGETVLVDHETLLTASKTLYIRSMLLALRKQDLINKLKRLRDKDKIINFEINYDVHKETRKLASLSKEELNNYFAGE